MTSAACAWPPRPALAVCSATSRRSSSGGPVPSSSIRRTAPAFCAPAPGRPRPPSARGCETARGEYVPVEVSFRPSAGHAGRLGEVTTVARPLVERRADDDAGRIAETRFRSLFGTLPHASALIGPDGRIVRANLALARLTGYSADQLEGAGLGTLVDDEDAARLRRPPAPGVHRAGRDPPRWSSGSPTRAAAPCRSSCSSRRSRRRSGRDGTPARAGRAFRGRRAGRRGSPPRLPSLTGL